MQIQQIADNDVFLEATGEFLARREDEYNWMLGSLERQIRHAAPSYSFMAKVSDGTDIALVALLAPSALFLSRGPINAIALLCETLRASQFDINAICGPDDEVDQFVSIWTALCQCRSELLDRQILYKLTEVRHPQSVSGSARLMTSSDVETVTSWEVGFSREALQEELGLESATSIANGRVTAGDTFIWEHLGQPVSMAALARPTANGVALNSVYTPLKHRRNGYAAALVARLTELALTVRGKKFCVLYADSENATSCKIYESLGYRALMMCKRFSFAY